MTHLPCKHVDSVCTSPCVALWLPAVLVSGQDLYAVISCTNRLAGLMLMVDQSCSKPSIASLLLAQESSLTQRKKVAPGLVAPLAGAFRCLSMPPALGRVLGLAGCAVEREYFACV